MNIKKAGWLIYLLTVFVTAWLLIDPPQRTRFALDEKDAPGSAQTPRIRSEFISGGLTEEVHSATAVELGNGDIAAFWYAGTREGSSDVAIYSRFLNKPDNMQNAVWSDVRQVIDRSRSIAGLQRHIRKLGNPVAIAHKGELWLFYVTVSVGGWAGSSLNLIKSSDHGKSWGSPRRLITSSFLNISTLVKERAVIAEDGSMLLPVYHEFIGKFSELLHLDPQGRVLDKYRISHGRMAIQPVVVPTTEDHAVVFMRNATQGETSAILTSHTDDGGENWQPVSMLDLPNPNSAVTSVSLDRPGELLLVFNNDVKERSDLTLAYAANYLADGTDRWQIIHEFENQAEHAEEDIHNPYSYPFLIKTTTGDFHLFYTWKRRHIKHVFFNRAALDNMIESQMPTDLQYKVGSN
jgi:predicted neuraminidase